MLLNLIATTTFGLEAVVKREIEALGFKIIKVSDGKIMYEADERGIVISNIHLRSADRVLIKMAEFPVYEFEDLFQGVKAVEWERWIPKDGNFVMNCSAVRSKLGSIRACQSVAEKAVIERLAKVYSCKRFSKTGANFPLKISILKDVVTVTLDTTGAGLHKRGYRKNAVAAPIKETMAAALVSLSFWKEGRILVDPCCGSGTIAIEAAMMARNIAPGLNRKFLIEDWKIITEKIWKEERKKAYESIKEANFVIKAYDIDAACVSAARENAIEAGVDEDIEFRQSNIKDLEFEGEQGIVIANPPYGTRIGDQRVVTEFNRGLARLAGKNPTWSFFIITADKDLEKSVFKRDADRRRKLYNGDIEVCYYQFHGEKK
ncbi:MAG: THUMP domain-containing class I SAM-dependent RNA methyltransferase [Eubacteriales bacterium]